MFLFIAVISLLINLSIVGVSALTQDTQFNSIDTKNPDLPKTNVTVGTIGNVVTAIGTSFLPFIDLVNIVTLDLSNIPFVLVFYGVIVLFLGALKFFLLASVIANFIPLVNL